VRAETGRELPPPRTLAGEREEQKGAWIEMWQGPYRGRTIMMVAYNLLQTIGYYGFASWVPTLLISNGITTTQSLLYSSIIAIANPFGPRSGSPSPTRCSANGRWRARRSRSRSSD
jgi:MFS transporter, putative metabolite:H+ symporter